MFIECKAKGRVDQDPYYKLESLVNSFGVNAAPVPITDTQEEGTEYYAINGVNRERGSKLKSEIKTVWESEKIKDIGNTLKDHMEEYIHSKKDK